MQLYLPQMTGIRAGNSENMTRPGHIRGGFTRAIGAMKFAPISGAVGGCNKRSASHQKSTHNSTAFRKHLYALRRCKPFIGCNKRSALRRQPSAFRRPSGDAPRFGPTKLYRPETQPMFFTFFQAMPEIFDSVQSRNPTAAKAKISAAAALRRVLPHALF